MCTVSIRVDEAVLREKLPELKSTDAIRRWAQELIDMHIREIAYEEDVEMIDLESMRQDLHQMVRDVYAQS